MDMLADIVLTIKVNCLTRYKPFSLEYIDHIHTYNSWAKHETSSSSATWSSTSVIDSLKEVINPALILRSR